VKLQATAPTEGTAVSRSVGSARAVVPDQPGGTASAVVDLARPEVSAQALREAIARRMAPQPLGPLALAVKRALDLVGAAVLLLATAPVLVLTALAVKLESRGPVLFTQVRTGRDGTSFRILKFRSMVVGGDDSAHRAYVASLIAGEAGDEDGVFKLVSDPRVTRVGRFIRRYSLDELPQLWNVLRGDMSLVGPRPALPHEVELYDARARQRLAVKPGLTGLWQVSGRCELSFADMVALDVAYSQRWSLLQDLHILARTPLVALTGRGAA
jgi:lipopolysaccharide/colanic/teichoic acid biosynthesis glycosyltransferase